MSTRETVTTETAYTSKPSEDLQRRSVQMSRWEEDYRKYKDSIKAKKEDRNRVRMQLHQRSTPTYTTTVKTAPVLTTTPTAIPTRTTAEIRETRVEAEPVEIQQPLEYQPSYESCLTPAEMERIKERSREAEARLEQTEWVPSRTVILRDEVGLGLSTEAIGKFPIEPEQFFPEVKEEIHLGVEDESELVHRVGVKCGIHLQALTRDLNRLSALVEGPIMRPYRRESIFLLIDLLDDVDRMDADIKKLLSNLLRDQREREIILKQMLCEEEEDETREVEALRRRALDRVIRERIIMPKKREFAAETPIRPTTTITQELVTPAPEIVVKEPEVVHVKEPEVVQVKEEEPMVRIEKDIKTEERTITYSKAPAHVTTHEPFKSTVVTETFIEPTQVSTPVVSTPVVSTPIATTPVMSTTPSRTVKTTTTPKSEIISERTFTTSSVSSVGVPGLTRKEQPVSLKGGKWRSLRFQPVFDVQDTANAIILSAYLPGINKNELALELGKDSFTIEGYKEPTSQEESLLREDVLHSHPGAQNIDELISMAGSGKYGTFSETYSLPQNADKDKLRASYEGGILQIIIPKREVLTKREGTTTLPVASEAQSAF